MGISTISDRIAQTVVKRSLEARAEPVFDNDSYGYRPYRPGRSAHQALEVARQRCWNRDWVLDLDIKNLFDSIDRGLMMRAVRCHTGCAWQLYVIFEDSVAPDPELTGIVVRLRASRR
ncbi:MULTISPECIES: reverse transcriptase domain-containing protein [Burkholderiaceae]|uniref:reverse transcriptase domain-containing protein n=1 Tax=Burkholderiaceae TaxID=119060 RepID=UPI0007840CA1|nr:MULTISPECIES: reverse transcriptase domain-containing protein [Burkholderiaceae]